MNKKDEIYEILDYYASQRDASSQENIVAMLREIQDVEGFISKEVRTMIQERFKVKETFLTCILKMYPSLKQIDYSHEIILCTGERCGNKNSMALLELLKKELQPSKEGISKDGTIRLSTRNCLKKCKIGPNMLLDGEVCSNLNQEKILELLKNLKNQ